MLVRLPPFLGFKHYHPRDVTLPLTIAYIGTMARQRGWQVDILDVWGCNQTMRDVLRRIRLARPDVILFEMHAPPFPVIMKCAEALREFSDAWLLAFGSVPTFMPERVVGPDLPIDVAIAGESEMTAMALLDAHAEGRPIADIAGIAHWDNEHQRMRQTPAAEPLKELDSLPMIDYELLDIDRYHKYSFPMPIHRRVRWGYVLATRGCPYPCTHCSFDHRQSFGRRFRKHSPERVVDELALLSERYGINAVSFEDDVFTLDRDWVLAICDQIESRGVNVKWIVQTRVDLVDRDLIRRIKRAGCVGVSFGIESGSDRVLKVLKKGFTRDQALQGIRLCQDEGLMLRLLFMIGNPTETVSEIEDTIDLVEQAKAITIQVHISTPYPGTGLLGEADGDGRYITDFSSYNRIVYNVSEVADDELWQLQKMFYRRYYFSLRYLRLFLQQRLFYLAGSWRQDVPLIAKASWYLVWGSRRQGERDVEGMFAGTGAAKTSAGRAIGKEAEAKLGQAAAGLTQPSETLKQSA
jgi:radical SAM superfamily enzyme YgiQ (UPF0313 family)